MRDFKIAQPKTTEELAALLAETPERTALMAGATDLLDRLKSGVAAPDLVIDIQGIAGLAGVTEERDGLRIGAMTRVSALAADAAVARNCPVLKEAALSLASPQLRNLGTVGGNLCQRPRCWYFRDPQVVCLKKGGFACYAFQGRNKSHAILGGGPCYIVYPSDLAPVLISLGARVTIGGGRGTRVLPLEEFYKPPSVNVEKENILERDQFVVDIRVPAPRPGLKGTYVKLKERATWDFALASAAVTGVVAGRTFSDIAIVCGGVAPVPWRMKKAEDILRGKPVTEDLLDRAAREALAEAKPLAENAYKTALATAAIKKGVLALVGS